MAAIRIIGVYVLLTACAALGIGLVAEFGFRMSSVYAPRYEALRRTTFEQSRAFQEGTVRDLENLSLDYARGDAAQKDAIRATALHRLADVPDEMLTPTLRAFKAKLQAEG